MDSTFVFLTLCAPLLSALVVHITASEKAAGWLSTLLLTVALSGAAGLLTTGMTTLELTVRWWTVGQLSMDWQILVSPFVKLMMFAVVVVSWAVHAFSISYITQSKKRYFATLGLFTFSMLGLLISDHLMVLFCFWELMGVCSYLLIGFWRERPSAAAAATKAFLMNKLGDGALLAAILLLYVAFDTFQLSSMLGQTEHTAPSLLIGVLFFFAMAAKSAQWPLHSWLPDAMAGPTPVSALIHAATMVAAGVVLYARVYALLPPELHAAICFLSLFSACLGGYQALVAYDIKKILAYSTLSQLGLMMAAIAAGATSAGQMHLLAHAFFKAGLFLSAGLIIHHIHKIQPEADPQDLRFMGGLRSSEPRLFFLVLVLLSALVGLPLTSGFLSKENLLAGILAYTASSASPWSWILVALFFITTFLTVWYSWRLLAGIFLGVALNKKLTSPATQWLSAMVLAIGSGWYMISMHPLHDAGWLAKWLDAPLASGGWWLVLISVLWITLAGATAYFVLVNKRYRLVKPLPVSIDQFYTQAIIRPVQSAAWAASYIDTRWLDGWLHGLVAVKVTLAHVVSWLDQKLVDGLVNGVGRSLGAVGSLTRKPVRGEVQRYLTWAVAGMIILLFWMLI
jgi:NADH-quinone oxidoreductase subunit L